MIKTSVGFIGAGVLASSFAGGLCGSHDFDGEIWVWNRSSARADEMRAICPERIHIASTPSEVCERSEVVFPSVLPNAIADVMRDTRFREENSVVHVIGGVSLADTGEWYAPAHVVARAVPLPFTRRRIGPVLIYGADEKIRAVASLVGRVVETRSEHELKVLAVVTTLMAPYLAVVGESVRWCADRGVDFAAALEYTNTMNIALSEAMRLDCEPSEEGVERMIERYSTPGGYNELALRTMRDAGCLDAWRAGMEKVGEKYVKG